MKIIHWIKQFYPYMGGGETALYELCKQIEQEPSIKENVIITTRLKGTPRTQRLFKKTRIVRIGAQTDYDKDGRITLLLKNVLRDFSLYGELKKEIDDKTVIHVHGPITPPLVLRPFKKIFSNNKNFQPWTKFNKPVIMHYHAIPAWQKEWLKKTDLQKSSAIISVDTAITRFLNHEKTVFIPNGVDTQKFKPSKKIRKNITFVGRIIPIKGWDTFVEATRNLDNVLIIGHGPQEEELKRRYKGELLTTVKNDEMPNYYAKTNILVSPLVNLLGISRVLLEAMASGCIAIKSDYDPDTYPIKQGFNGFTFKTSDAKDLEKVINQILGMSEKDKNIIRGRARKIIVTDFDARTLSKKVIKEYQKAFTRREQGLKRK